MVKGLGLRGSGFSIWNSRLKNQDSRLSAWGPWCGVHGAGFRGAGCRVPDWKKPPQPPTLRGAKAEPPYRFPKPDTQTVNPKPYILNPTP
jgi:hypothetical protein